MLDSSMDGSCELIASITSKDALIILLFLDVIINNTKKQLKLYTGKSCFNTQCMLW